MIGKTYVVGFTGLAQSGKDTFVNHLLRLGDIVVEGKGKGTRYAFADELKRFYAAARTIWAYKNAHLGGIPTLETHGVYQSFMASLPSAGHVQKVLTFIEGMFSSDVELASTPYRVESEEDKKIHRKNLIAVGMFFRQLDSDFWVNHVERKILIDDQSKSVPFAFISDVRFENERRICDQVIRVYRPGASVIMRDGKIDPSEVFAVEGYYDDIIANGGSMLDLQSKANAYLFRAIQTREWKLALQGR